MARESTFTLAPQTTSEAPHPLEWGETFSLTARIENASHRTDRYFLTLLDMPMSWFSVSYPESDENLPGLITRTDGLQLNPGEIGEIVLHVHPPGGSLAGNYFPTVQLSGSNRDEIVLFEVIYLTLPADDRLAISLTPEEQTIPTHTQTDEKEEHLQWAAYQVQVKNLGNMLRYLRITAQGPTRTVRFLTTPDTLTLKPGEQDSVWLEATPRWWFQRLCHRKSATLSFPLALENVIDSSDHFDPEKPRPNVPTELPEAVLH